MFAHIERVAERHIGHLPSREYGRMRLAGKDQSQRSNGEGRSNTRPNSHLLSPGHLMADTTSRQQLLNPS